VFENGQNTPLKQKISRIYAFTKNDDEFGGPETKM
jgi:hypothetical protein